METANAIIEAPQPERTTSALTLIRPIAQPTDLLALHDEVTAIIQKSLQLGLDYDAIPGTGDKPSLLKPGAEKLNLAFGAAPEYEIVEKEIDHDREVRWTKRKKKWNNRFKGDRTFEWETEEGTSLGLYRYVIRCRLVRQGRVLATCIGECSTLESKYIDRPRDCGNTVLKMAQKRAFVGATLHAYGLSNRFTQDVEDNRDLYAKEPPPAEDVPFAGPPAKVGATPAQAQQAAKRERTPYDPLNSEHEKALFELLKFRKVPEDFWEEIHRRMEGKSLADVSAVVEQVRAGA